MLTVNTDLLGPVIVLVSWTMVMWLWMYATRLPAIKTANIKPDPYAPRGEQMSQLPANVRWKADNYNHLLEQPTIFYPLVISLALLGVDSSVAVTLAWSYVIIRITHSLFQALVNKIEIRFLLFFLSNIPLIGLSIIALQNVL